MRPEPRPRRVGLVLGGGGTAGLAFHAGTLLALHHDLGWDPARADVLVGTSAGSIVAGLLRGGATTDDLAAWGTDASPRQGGRGVRRVLDGVDETGMRLRPRLVPGRFPTPRWLGRSSDPASPLAALLTLLPGGPFDGATAVRRAAALLTTRPDERLLVTAVRTRDARRIVFGRDADAPLADAVAASCAVPGLFRPVRIGGVGYIDGGAHSPTNADVLADAPVADRVDVAVVLSPMSARAGAAGGRADALLRGHAARRLAGEVRRLEAAGITTVVVEPSAAALAAMGWNPMARANVPAVVQAAFLTADTAAVARATGLTRAA